MSSRVSIHLAGREVVADESQTILEVARANGVFIPTLCHLAGLSSVGACRLCVVEIRGVMRLAAACTTRVRDGMEVTVDSPRLADYRRTIVELLLAERNHVCSVCVANGNCELQSLAQTLGVMHTRYAYRYPKYAVDASHPRFVYDANRCVLCTRCVRVCAEVEGAHTWTWFVAAARRGSPATSTSRGAKRRVARRAANACASARPARSAKRDWPSASGRCVSTSLPRCRRGAGRRPEAPYR